MHEFKHSDWSCVPINELCCLLRQRDSDCSITSWLQNRIFVAPSKTNDASVWEGRNSHFAWLIDLPLLFWRQQFMFSMWRGRSSSITYTCLYRVKVSSHVIPNTINNHSRTIFLPFMCQCDNHFCLSSTFKNRFLSSINYRGPICGFKNVYIMEEEEDWQRWVKNTESGGSCKYTRIWLSCNFCEVVFTPSLSTVTPLPLFYQHL